MARNEFTDSILPLAGGALLVMCVVFGLIFKTVSRVRDWEQMGKATPTARTSDQKPTDEWRPGTPGTFPNPAPPGGPVFTPSAPAGVSTATATEMIGQWTRTPEGLTEVWTVQCPGGRWEVYCRYFDGAKEVGSFIGLDVKVSGAVLSFTQQFDKQPPRPWRSGATITAQIEGDKLAFTWRFGGSSGTATLVRSSFDIAPPPTASELIGRWTRRVDTITEVWTVRCPEGKWEVSCQYFEGTLEIASLVGSDVKVSGTALSFTQQHTKPPLRPLQGGAAITAQIEDGKLVYTWKLAGGGSGTHPLARVEE